MAKVWKWCLYDQDKKELCTGWHRIDGKWYWLWGSGIMASNEWIKYKDKWYYLNKDGDMAINTTIGNWIIDSEGVATKQVNTNSNLFEFIKKFEGCYTKVYTCPSGILTIGIGCTNTKWTSKGTITIDQCKEAFNEDIKRFTDGVNNLCSKYNVKISDVQKDALISFSFNCGLVALEKSTLWKDIQARNWSNITKDFLMWNKSNGRVLEGLTRRRQAEAKLFTTGKYN